MMKSITRLSVWVAFAALLCFAPSAFGQGTVNTKGTGAGYNLLNNAPSGFLAYTFGFGGDPRGGDHHGGNGGGGNGCSNQGSYDNGWGGGGNNGSGGCTSVPEGGTTLMYGLLAGLCCLGAIAFRFRRQAALSETN